MKLVNMLSPEWMPSYGVSGPNRKHGEGTGYNEPQKQRQRRMQSTLSKASPEHAAVNNATRNTQCWDLGLEFIVLFNAPLLYLAFEIHRHSFILFL